MTAIQPLTSDCPITGIGSMRSNAARFLDQVTLPRHGLVARFARDFTDCLHALMPCVEQLAALRGADDVPAQVALVGVGEARRRLTEPGGRRLSGEVARVRRLARSVRCLCDHYDTLTAART